MDRLPWPTSVDPIQKSEKVTGPRRLTHLQRVLCAVIDIIEATHHKFHALVKTSLVKPIQVGKMNLKPTQTAFAERFCFCKLQKATGQVIANVTQMRGNGVRASTEIDVMR